MEWKYKAKICIVKKNIAYPLIWYLNYYCIVSPAHLFDILPARFRCSFEEKERERERVEKQCMKGKQILLCERLLKELKTVWNIIFLFKRLAWCMFSMSYWWHRNITRVCFVAQQSTQSMSLFSEREKKCGTQQRQQQTNNHTLGGLENFLRHPLERQIIRMLQKHKEENEEQMSCQKFVGWR